MDWSRIKRAQAPSKDAPGVYADLDRLIRIQFEVRDFSFRPQQPVSSILSGRYGSRLRGRGLNFEELRQYHPGDDIRTMDWKVTARTRSPHVRVYTEEKDRGVLLLVDQRQNMFFGSRDRLKSVTAAELAALAAWRALDSGDRVGAIVFNDAEIAEYRPQRSRSSVMQILGEVIRQNHELAADSTVDQDPGQLNRVLDKARVHAKHDVLIILISDGLGADEHTEKLTAGLVEHNDLLVLLVHDPSRVDPKGPRLTLSDGSRQMGLDLSDPAVGAAIADDYRDEREGLNRYLRRISAPMLMISNQGDVADQVRRLLGVPGEGLMDPSASLANLRDIAVPEPPPFWPPAPGVWVLLIVAAALISALAILLWRGWTDNAYRRAGIALLEDAQTTRDVNIVLKRVALAVFPRPEVAQLYGDDWAAFLDASSPGVRFAGVERRPDDTDATRELRSQAETWIRRHRKPGV